MAREFKDSGIEWIGQIPKEWKVVRAKGLFVQRSTKGNSQPVLLSATQKQGMLPQYLLEGVVQTNKDTDLQTFKTVHKNDFVISLRSFQGGFEKSDYEGVCSPAYQVFYNRAPINYSYFWQLFKSVGFIDKINSLTVGIREGKNIQYKDFADMYLAIPSLPEQQKIADYLDKVCGEVDEMVSLQEKMIEELKAYKQSVITEAVTKGLNPNAPMKDSGIDWIGEIPEQWNVCRFKEKFTTGKGLTFTKADLVQDGYPVISYGQVHSKRNTGTEIDVALIRHVPATVVQGGGSSFVHVGDFIFADTSEDISGCGNCVYVNEDIGLYAGYHTVIAFSKREESNKYLAYLFLTDCWRSQIRSRVSGIKVFSISQAIIKQTTLIIPPPFEQQQIASYLDTKCSEIDSLIVLKQQKIEELKEYKKSVIYEYVTGKKEVA